MEKQVLTLLEDISIALNKYVAVAKLQSDSPSEVNLSSEGVTSTTNSPPPPEEVSEVTPNVTSNVTEEDDVIVHSELLAKGNYSHINFSPPKAVVEELKRGLEWNYEGHGGDGLVPATVAW